MQFAESLKLLKIPQYVNNNKKEKFLQRRLSLEVMCQCLRTSSLFEIQLVFLRNISYID
jgi:hypothetical protein